MNEFLYGSMRECAEIIESGHPMLDHEIYYLLSNICRHIERLENEPLTGQADKDCSVGGVVE
jgi:hypothetical protein